MTIKEFRDDPERVAALRKLLSHPTLIEAREILGSKGPGVIRSDISETFAAVKLGHAAGWTEYHETLAGMATHSPDSGDVDNEKLIEEE